MSGAPKETRNQQIDEAAEQLLRDMDVMVDKLAPIGDTLPNETVSGHVAREAAAGKHWACVFCKFLSWGVERDHCEDTLAGDVMPWWVYPRALFWFVLVLGMPGWVWLAWHWLNG